MAHLPLCILLVKVSTKPSANSKNGEERDRGKGREGKGKEGKGREKGREGKERREIGREERKKRNLTC
jgi:hypothetical protein